MTSRSLPLLLALAAALWLPASFATATDNAAAPESVVPSGTDASKRPSAQKTSKETSKADPKLASNGAAKASSRASSKAHSKTPPKASSKGASKAAAKGNARGAGIKASAGSRKAGKSRATHTGAEEPEFTNFTQWQAVSSFIDEMSSEHGFDREQLRSQFSRAHYIDAVVKLINPPPAGKAKNWTAYRERFVEPKRIQAGITFWQRHEDALRRAEAEFGVPAEIIVGIIGVETFYGRDPGRFRVMDSLATLAFAYPDTPNRDARKSYFRNELRQLLLYARESELDPFALQGSFAGAIGWPQFMPGSIRKFAVDFDGDGKIDLRNSPVDAIGSVASFLSNHGWMTGLPLVFPVTTLSSADAGWPGLIGQSLEARHTVDQMQSAGVSVPDSVPTSLTYGLVDLQDGDKPTRYWLGSGNFFAITQYNRSFFYAMAVIELGQTVAQQRMR